MSGRRFMINSRSIRNGYASFDGELHNHIVRVLRLGTGDPVILVDEREDEHEGVIDQVTRDWVAVKITGKADSAGSEGSGPRITLCQALPKGDKVDLILQKGTELGPGTSGSSAAAARWPVCMMTSGLSNWSAGTG